MKKTPLLLLVYLIIATVICQLFPGYELIKAFLALPGFLIIPILIGQLFLKKSYILSWLAGSLLLYAVYFISHQISIVLIAAAFLMLLSVILNRKIDFSFKVNKKIILVIVLGLLIALALSYFSPYPYVHDVDPFSHTQYINLILEGKYLSIQSAYLPVFHVLIALLSVIFNFTSHSFDIFWAARFLVFPIYSLGIFLFLKEVIKNKNIALLGALVAPLVTIEYLSLINFAPKIISLIILPYILFFIIKTKKIKIIHLIIITLALLSIHYWMGLVNLLVIFSFLFFKKFYYPKLILATAIIPVLFILLQALDILSFQGLVIDFIGAADLRSFNFNFNWERFLEYFPPIILIAALLGIIFRRKDKNVIVFIPAIFIIIGAYFLPLNAGFRVLASVIPLIILFICLFVFDFYKVIKYKKVFLLIFLPLLIIAFIQPYYSKINKWSSYPQNEGYFTIVTPKEHSAADWIRENVPNNVHIISDPVNSVAISALSENNPLLSKEETIEIMTSQKVKKTHQQLKDIESDHQKKFIIYIDGRTSFWVKNRKDEEIYNAPNVAKKFSEFKGFKKFLNEEYFKIIYQQDETYLFEVL